MTQDINNTKSDEMRRRMLLLEKHNLCFFCKEGQELFEKNHLYEGKHWYVATNDNPYKGSVTHVVVVPQRHITNPEELTSDEFIELTQTIIPWMRNTLDMSGMSGLFRFGNTKITGATLHHLHIHFICGVERTDANHDPVWAVVGFQKP